MLKNFINNKSGVTAIEIAVILPTFLLIVFYIIELLFINSVKSSLLAISVEATQYFAKYSNTNKFEEYIKKYKKKYLFDYDIKYYINLESNGCTAEEVYWPTDYTNEEVQYIDKNNDMTRYVSNNKINAPSYDRTYTKGKWFILTFVVKYKFTNALTKLCFSSGTNTRVGSKKGQAYLIYSRGVGICE